MMSYLARWSFFFFLGTGSKINRGQKILFLFEVGVVFQDFGKYFCDFFVI